MRKKLLSILALLCLTVTSAWAQEVSLLTTIESKDYTSFKSGSQTFNNIATVNFSGEVSNDNDYWGWYYFREERTLTVTAAEGYTITRVKFYTDSSSAFDEEAPFEAILAYYNSDYIAKVNGTSIGEVGVNKIEVYGYAGTPAPASYNVTATSAGGAYWATFYTEAGNYQASEGTQVFAVTLTGTSIEMTEIPNRIALSGKGVVLKKTTTGGFTMTKTETAPDVDYSGSSLTGTMTSITNPSYGNIYVLNNDTYGVGFYKLQSDGTIGANKAYLTTAAGAREFFLFDEATGIEMPTVEDVNADAVVYDLQGRRVQNPTKGLYIVNGKKVFINK